MVQFRPRAVAGELRWILDPSDPLRPYNQRLVSTFMRHDAGAVVRGGRLIPTDGHTLKVQAKFMRQLLARYPWINRVLEIGFNAGHSSYLFLSARPDVQVVSFDLSLHDYVDHAKGLLDRTFPGRHELVPGDSRQTVPAYADANPDARFDLVYIDGGHTYELASADIANCMRLSTPSTVVLMDDVQPEYEWGEGPARAWSDAVASGLVEQTALVADGVPLVEQGPEAVGDAIAWALGRYPEAS